MRHFVTFFDAGFVSYASLSISSVLKTQHFDRLSLIFPSGDASDPADVVAADLARYFSARDPRIVPIPLAEISNFPELSNATLRRSHPLLFSDILRAHLFAYFSTDLVWFDADMLLLKDISEVFDHAGECTLAAAPDRLARTTQSAGRRAHDAFVRYLQLSQPYIRTLPMPINCGLLWIAGELRPQFNEGLEWAVRFLADESHHSATALDDSARSSARRSVGQLAWNYVFQSTNSRLLPVEYNFPAFPEVRVGGDGKLAVGSRCILHYIGDLKRRMSTDFVILRDTGGFDEQGSEVLDQY
jgi:hypothetical protein